MKPNILLLFIFLMASVSCQNDDGNDPVTFHIAVANQSIEIDPVGMKVLLLKIINGLEAQ